LGLQYGLMSVHVEATEVPAGMATPVKHGVVSQGLASMHTVPAIRTPLDTELTGFATSGTAPACP
jgi:hypothetical protein